MHVHRVLPVLLMTAALISCQVGSTGYGSGSGSISVGGSNTAPTIYQSAFHPSAITISAGMMVTWTNDDGFAHTVTDDGAAFNSGPMAAGASYSLKLTLPGTYHYHCNIHVNMKGTIVVS
jgi:plastocyanin